MTYSTSFGILYAMKTKRSADAAKTAFLKIVESHYPVARGSLVLINKRCNSPYCRACKKGEGHPSWIFKFRIDGKQHSMHVQPRHVETLRQAIENGRIIEKMLLDEGIALLKRLRDEDN